MPQISSYTICGIAAVTIFIAILVCLFFLVFGESPELLSKESYETLKGFAPFVIIGGGILVIIFGANSTP